MKSAFIVTFVVAALGYFVDIYDLIIFGVVRIESLKAIGIVPERILDAGMLLINCQMAGMLVGGFFWGILGDTKGRTTVMISSILIYSLANIANAFVFSLNFYAILRFIAGFGLSGEVGAAVTLISENASQKKRMLWTTGLTAFGLMGAVAAGLVGAYLHWQIAYLIGGILGLALLLLRFKIGESVLFKNSVRAHRGRIDFLWRSQKNFLRYLACIFIGIPIWYVVGILMTFSPELMKSQGVTVPVAAGDAILFCYIGICLGDLFNGLVSHICSSRRWVIGVSLILWALISSYYLHIHSISLPEFYALCILLGFSVGYWAVYVTLIAESFGTNIRATAVVTITNWMRASVLLLTSSIQWLQQYMTLSQSSWIISGAVFVAAFASLIYLSETSGKDMDYCDCPE